MVCLLISACGSQESAKEQGLDYFSSAVKVSSLLYAGTVQASNLTISGISRTVDAVTLRFSVDVTSADATERNASVVVSGKDRYGLQVLSYSLPATVPANGTVAAVLQQTIPASSLVQVESWLIQDVTFAQPTAPIAPAAPSAPVELNPTTATRPVLLTDENGLIQVMALSNIENFRTATKVNFSTAFEIVNTSAERINFEVTFAGLDAAGTTIFSRPLNKGLDGGKTSKGTVSYGDVLAIADYEKITTWKAMNLKLF